MSKSKKYLVDQYLENMSRDTLKKYQSVIRKYAGRKHGIYALYRRDKLYYVGLASNLRRRLTHHLRDRHANSWDRFSIYLTSQDKHLRELETLVLRIIDRKGNRQRGKFGYAEDLRTKVKNDLKKILSIELEDLLGKRSGYEPRTRRSRIKDIEKKQGRKPTLAPFIKERFIMRFKHQNKLYVARVQKNGLISFSKKSAESKRLQGKIYTSPSLAAKAITGRSMNGWKTWKYKNKSGKWVLLDKLRK